MSMVGGVLSDKYLGQRKAVTFGAILLVLGHFGMAFEGAGSKETLSFNGGDYLIEDVGRDDRRQLFLDYEGESRRLVFDSVQFAQLGTERFYPILDDGEGDYIVERQRRGLVQNICNVVGLGCAGPDPETTLVLNGQRLNVTSESKNEQKENVLTLADGRTVTERSETDILVLKTATEEKFPDVLNPIAIAAHGEYSTSVEKQGLFVNILFFSLALIIAGVGFLKPNISTIVGDLYPKGDPRRDGGFTLFYMGINLGSFLATWSCGILGIVFGWAWGFGLAGVGMLLGLIVFQLGQSWLDGVANPPSAAKLKEKIFGPINVEWACYLSAVGVVLLCMGLLKHASVIGPIAAGVGIIVFIGFIIMSFTNLQGKERTRMWAALYFAVAQIPFWSLFEQAGSSLTLVTSRLVDTTMFGWDVPTPVFQSLNAGFIFIFAPFIAMMWVGLANRKLEPSTPVKFALGVFGAGLGYLVLVAGMGSVGPAALTPCLLYTSPSPRDKRQSRMPSSA